MEFKLNDYHRNVSDEELLLDLKRVSIFLNKDTVTIDDYNSNGKYHATTLTRRFGSWFICLEKAELNISRSRINISNEDLFEEIERVWMILGKQPTYAQIDNLSVYSASTYANRFGSWRKALEPYVDYINSENVTDELYIINDVMNNSTKHKTKRDINLRMRFLIMKRDKFKCCMCGRSPATTVGLELHIDHIVPWSKGGETVIDNLQTLCSDCNLGKSNLSETE